MLKYFLFILALTLTITACTENKSQTEQTDSPVSNTGNTLLDGLSREIAGKPNNPELRFARAQAFYDNGAYDQALIDIDKALESDSLSVKFLHLKADIQLDYLRSRQALATMDFAAKKHPENIPTLLKYGEFQLILKQYAGALETTDKILNLDPQNAEGHFLRGRILEDQGKETAAIESYQSAVENEPDLLEVWIKLGYLAAARNRPIAEQYFDTAVEIDTSGVSALFAKADYFHSTGKLNEAIALYKKVNVRDPQFADSYYNAGLAQLELDSSEAAYRLFDLAIQMEPTYVMAQFYKGQTAELLGKKEEAISQYKNALALQPGFKRASEALLRLESQQE